MFDKPESAYRAERALRKKGFMFRKKFKNLRRAVDNQESWRVYEYIGVTKKQGDTAELCNTNRQH